MTELNSRGEVADFADVSQFAYGLSAYMCVAFSAALCKYAGQPGHGASGTASQVEALARFWYSKEEGSDSAANKNGMSLEALYKMLEGLDLQYHAVSPNVAQVKAWLLLGKPVILCGAETGMYDMDLGDKVPYAWTPTGNHAIVASGIAPDGNLLVRDTANIGPNGLRPGPRRYDASRMMLVSATAIELNGGTTLLQLNSPMGQHFSASSADRWHCTSTNVDLAYAHLAFYRQFEGVFGLPLTNEIYLAQLPGTAIIVYERAIAIYDPKHTVDNPPGAGSVYLMHVDSGVAQQIIAKPLVTALQAQISKLQADLQTAQASAPSAEIEKLQNQIAGYQAGLNQVEAIVSQMKGRSI